MIYLRNFLIGLICLAACTSTKKETTETVVDSTETEEPKQEHLREQSRSFENGLTFDIDKSIELQHLQIFGKSESVAYWITKFYSQDHRVDRRDTLKPPNYLIKSVDLTEQEYINGKGECESRSVLMVFRDMSGEEYYDIHFLTNDTDVTSEKVTYDGSIAQSTGSVSLSTEFKLSKNCPTLAVVREYEGGDIDFGRMKEISFFIVTESGMESVFDLVREYTLVKEYEVSGDENKNSTSEIRDFKILRSKTNNLFDIKVHTTTKMDGKVTEEKNAIFRFDGEKYSEKS